jgi:uncharacterized RDD family membrane protein YckC
MSENYFIQEDNEQKGPFTFEELTDRGLDIHTRVLSPITNSWQDACDLPEFFAYFEAHGVYFPTEDNLASFWWRLLAYTIDYVILSIVLQYVFAVLTQNGVIHTLKSYSDIFNLSVRDWIILQLVSSVTLILYNSIGEASAFKGSLGKKLCGLVVVDADGTGLTYLNALIRSSGKALSVFLFYLGFLSFFWSEHRQTVHDMLAKTYVVKKD